MASVSAGHIILTPTQPVGSGRPQRESNPGPPHQESAELPHPPVVGVDAVAVSIADSVTVIIVVFEVAAF